MKPHYVLSPLTAIVLALPLSCETMSSSTQPLSEAFGNLPLSFEANHGQTDPRVRYLVHGREYSLFLSDDEAVIRLAAPSTLNKRVLRRPSTQLGVSALPDTRTNEPEQRPAVIHMRLLGATHSSPSGLDLLPGVSNYIRGDNPKNWHTNIPTFSRVRYANPYHGIDLMYHGNQGRLEFDFIVQPGASPSQIAFEIDSSAQRTSASHPLSIDSNGDLVL